MAVGIRGVQRPFDNLLIRDALLFFGSGQGGPELRNSDRTQNADNGHNDHQFNERKTLVAAA
jgi:hypothetical protein